MRGMSRLLRMNCCLSISIVACLANVSRLNAQTLTWLGALSGDAFSESKDVSAGMGVSAGCDVAVIGRSVDANNNWHAFLWRNGQMIDLGTLGGSSYAWGISGDYKVIVGVSWLEGNQQNFAVGWFWECEDQVCGYRIRNLGTLGGTGSWARAVSCDGTRIVGNALTPSQETHAFLWQNNAMLDLYPTSSWSDAWNISPNGLAVVGAYRNDSNQYRAFLWTEQDGVRDLGVPSGEGWVWSFATAVSDNQIVVGAAENNSTRMAFRWSSNEGMQLLPLPAGYTWADAYGISADGTIIVGRARTPDWTPHAFRWTSAGAEDLNTTYAHLLTDGSHLSIARAISPDGRYITGWGFHASTGRTEAFVLDTQPVCGHGGDINCDGCVDDTDVLLLLFAFGEEGTDLGRVDVDCNGFVDDTDLLIVLFNFGICSGCPL